MAKSSSHDKPGFEESIARLEQIIQQTDAPVTELEQIIALVEEGTKLLRHCRSILDKAELRIEALENPEQSTLPGDEPKQGKDHDSNEFNLD